MKVFQGFKTTWFYCTKDNELKSVVLCFWGYGILRARKSVVA